MLLHWIWLSQRPRLNHAGAMALLAQFGDPEGIYLAGERELRRVPELRQEALEGLLDKDLGPSEEILRDCYDKGIHILTYQDGAYPGRLHVIGDPPLVLYYRGVLPDFDSEAAIAVVGTRSASPYGLITAKRLGYQIAQCGGLVISGLASGIDSMAMTGALTQGKPTVGVLGCGADIVYPRNNEALFADVIARGCLLTEYAPGTPPERYHFPRRNRIISGLSCGVLVVEAPEKSGALITAQYALDQGRDVFTVPGNIDVPSCVGSNRLLREGAVAVSSGWEIMEEYVGRFPGKIQRSRKGADLELAPGEFREISRFPRDLVAEPGISGNEIRKNSIDKEPVKAYSDPIETDESLTADEKALLTPLQEGPLHIDEIIVRSELSAPRALASLTLLEVKGRIRQKPGKIYELSGRS